MATITFTVIDATGHPVRMGSCPYETEAMNLQLSASGEVLLVNQTAPSFEHYWNNGSWVARPARPSAYAQWDRAAKQWVDPRSLAEVKAAKIESLRKDREVAEQAGFTWDGSPFDSDEKAQLRLVGLKLAALDPDYVPEAWRLANNTWRTLSATDVAAVWAEFKAHIRAQFVRFALREAAVNAASTAAEAEAVVW